MAGATAEAARDIEGGLPVSGKDTIVKTEKKPLRCLRQTIIMVW
jgi:hypothetical protein